MFRKHLILIIVLTVMLPASIAVAHSPPEGARVFFVGLEDGAMVASPFRVRFGIEGFGITPAGTAGKIRHSAGHHHLLIDVDQLPNMDEPIPRDASHIHFDQGETEATLVLPPGRHSLQLLLGDEEHEPQDPPLLSDRIIITVQ